MNFRSDTVPVASMTECEQRRVYRQDFADVVRWRLKMADWLDENEYRMFDDDIDTVSDIVRQNGRYRILKKPIFRKTYIGVKYFDTAKTMTCYCFFTCFIDFKIHPRDVISLSSN